MPKKSSVPMELYSQRQVGEFFGLDRTTISRLCLSGKINAVREHETNRVLGITKEEIERLEKMPRGHGENYLNPGRRYTKLSGDGD